MTKSKIGSRIDTYLKKKRKEFKESYPGRFARLMYDCAQHKNLLSVEESDKDENRFSIFVFSQKIQLKEVGNSLLMLRIFL